MNQYVVEYRFTEDSGWSEEFRSLDRVEAKRQFIDHVSAYPHTQCRMRAVEERESILASYILDEEF